MPRWIVAFALGICGAGTGCDTYVLLRSRCAGDAGMACGEPDAGPDSRAECKPGECPDREGCFEGKCASCAKLAETCEVCPPGTEPRKALVGDCVACSCTPVCKRHADCPAGLACVAGSCTPCDFAGICPPICDYGWIQQRVLRNGCKLCECAPKNECTADTHCVAGQICYPGQICDDGCSGDPNCCLGNLCAAPGCKPTDAVSCTRVGCADGTCKGDPACRPDTCKCDYSAGTPTGWICSKECQASCQ